jgi:DNA-binding response OmpR family regulator
VLVLVVDDEFLVQHLIQDVLTDSGFAVAGADDGAEAMALLERRAAELGGLVTDVNLGPGPSGWDVAHRARELNPTLPVIYVTGDSGHEWSACGVPNSVLVHKPFAGAEIVVALANLRAGNR